MLAKSDRSRVLAITSELDTIRLGARSVVRMLVIEMRQLIELDTVLVYSLNRLDPGWEIERWEHDGLSPRAEALLARVLRSTAVPRGTSPDAMQGLFYDPGCPRPDQRNRVVEATSWIERSEPGAWERSRVYTDVMRPIARHRDHLPRVLICEGPVLLAWVGGVHSQPLSRRQTQLFSALVPAMQRRLSIERRLGLHDRVEGALAVSLEQLGAPSFIVGRRGEIHEMNEAARALLNEQPGELSTALRDAIAGRPTRQPFELTAVRSAGVQAHWLAVMRTVPIETRIASCVRSAATRWQLTPRQTQVLGLVTRGMANASIAAMFKTGDRVVELHVTALFDHAGVDNRAALVARVLTIQD